jgi:hypothetical protein
MRGLMRRLVVASAAVVMLGPAVGAAAQADPALASAASGPRPGWSITPSPNPRAGNGGLNTVSCPTTSVCTAVGLHVRASGLGVTLAERRSGGVWDHLAHPAHPHAPWRRPTERGGVSRSCGLHRGWVHLHQFRRDDSRGALEWHRLAHPAHPAASCGTRHLLARRGLPATNRLHHRRRLRERRPRLGKPDRAVGGHRDVRYPNRTSRLLAPRLPRHCRLRPRSHGRRRRDRGGRNAHWGDVQSPNAATISTHVRDRTDHFPLWRGLIEQKQQKDDGVADQGHHHPALSPRHPRRSGTHRSCVAVPGRRRPPQR